MKYYKKDGLLWKVIKAKTDMSEDQQFDFYENMFNALADKIRLKILNQISQSSNKSLCVCDLEELLDIKQSKLSYHLKKLVDANVLIAEKHGTWNYYKINEQQIQVVLNEDTCCKIL
jgi:ArsR family transcriptional regulator